MLQSLRDLIYIRELELKVFRSLESNDDKQMIHLLQTKKKTLQSNCNSVYPLDTLKIRIVEEYKQIPKPIYAHKKQLTRIDQARVLKVA
jgi:hypothetical protein